MRLRSFPFVFASLFLVTQLVTASETWNNNIEWMSYEAGMGLAARHGKPVMLVFHSEGCGACADYSKLFDEDSVAVASRKFIMILMDDGANEEISTKYSPDGSYVPRTFFLDSQGSVLPIQIGKPDTRFQYYLGSQGADKLLEFMLLAQEAVQDPKID